MEQNLLRYSDVSSYVVVIKGSMHCGVLLTYYVEVRYKVVIAT